MGVDSRFSLLETWVKQDLNWRDAIIKVASADASFRRYFRIEHADTSYIAMDAPPDKEDISSFMDITQRLAKTEVHVPEIFASDNIQGFLMLEDLGVTAYLDVLDDQTADSLYEDAMQAIVSMQTADLSKLPAYDVQRLYDEMALMPEWFLQTHLSLKLSTQQQAIIETCFRQLITVISRQATGFVHRDYHSRNLMQTQSNNPGIIDYQDAVTGPLTYDLVSLLRDCYIFWPHTRVRNWALRFKQMTEEAKVLPHMSDKTFIRDMDLMGLQRHLKVLGIFSRLNHRDGKAHYLDDLPLTLSYVMAIGKRYPETRPLIQLFEELAIPQRISTVEIPS